MPAQQCFETGNAVVLQVDQWLVVYFQFAVAERLAQVKSQRSSLLHPGVHLLLEVLIVAAPFILCPVKCHVGSLEQHVRIISIFGRRRDTDAGADDHLVAVNLEWGADLGHDTLRKQAVFTKSRMALYDCEFVAAEPSHGIMRANRVPETLGDGLQKLVANRVTKRVIDILEVVEIQEQDMGRLVFAHCQQRGVQNVAEKTRFGKSVRAS